MRFFEIENFATLATRAGAAEIADFFGIEFLNIYLKSRNV